MVYSVAVTADVEAVTNAAVEAVLASSVDLTLVEE
jgi:hypothetical protein